jgi:hypothetical protein
MPGDADASGTLTSADVIYLVNYVFKGGPLPLPCAGAGDANCDGGVNASDIITVVNHLFKGYILSCDVCPLIWNGTWECEP